MAKREEIEGYIVVGFRGRYEYKKSVIPERDRICYGARTDLAVAARIGKDRFDDSYTHFIILNKR